MERIEKHGTSDRRRFLGAAAVGMVGLALPGRLGHSGGSAFSMLSPAPTAIAPGTAPLLNAADMPRLLPRALAALDRHSGTIPNRDLIGIVDFAQPSRDPRFHLVDLTTGKFDTHLVAHGQGSDPAASGWVERLSNQPNSNASCRGAFLVGETYSGKHGRSRRLAGLDSENSEALDRGIVIHAASYVDQRMARDQGRIGRSQGCFAVAPSVIGQVLERLGPGRMLFAWK